MQSIINYIQSHKEDARKELFDYLRIPSISADSQYHLQCDLAATFLADKLKRIGMENVHLVTGYGRPNVVADWLHAPGKPTVLIYGHYDVQPPDPLNEWVSPPFEPTVRDDRVYARGADDNKGQHWPWVRAIEAWLATKKKLPVNIKFVVEGEEECGGKAIHDCMMKKEFIDAWKADAVAISDSAWVTHELPTVDVGMRGLAYFELEVKGAKYDLHSGEHGNAAPNPIMILAQTFTKIQNEQGRIQIPGFYDDVLEAGAEERAMMRQLRRDDAGFMEEIGVKDTVGDKNYSYVERVWLRPSFEVHGIVGGYMQPGAKTVIPAAATAKISFRLVPNQDPNKVRETFKSYLKTIMPNSVTWKLRELGEGGHPLVVSANDPFLKALQPVYQQVFGKTPVYKRMGGSIPVATLFVRAWKVPILFMGLGWHDDQIHSPNEHLPLQQFYGGMELAARALEAWGDVKK